MILRRLFLAAILLCTSQAVIAETVSSFFVDLGEDVQLRGVTRLDDGTALLAGYSGDYGAGTRQAHLFEIVADGSSFTKTDLVGLGGQSHAWGVSSNGEYVVGFSQSPGSVSVGEGTVWQRSTGWTPQGIGVETLSHRSSVLFDVSPNGVAVGDQEGVRQGIRWSATAGVTIPSNEGVSTRELTSVTDDGRLAVGFGRLPDDVINVDPLRGFLTNGESVSQLPTPTDGDGLPRGISHNGLYIGGHSLTFDFETFQTITRPALWVDRDMNVDVNQSGSDYDILILDDVSQSVFEGEVRGISDNGYAVGGGGAGGAFIWHESFDGVRRFDEWLSTEIGIDLPTNPTNVWDVHFDGQNLNFAVEGSAYFVSANITAVPEPSAAGLLVLSTMAVCCRRRRKRT